MSAKNIKTELMNWSFPLVGAALLLVSCDSGIEYGSTRFVVRVDSLAHPKTAGANDTLDIRFYGTIGSDGCYSFSHFETATEPMQIDITAWGKHNNARLCPSVMVYLGGQHYRLIAGNTGWFVINTHQPDNEVLRDSILIQ